LHIFDCIASITTAVAGKLIPRFFIANCERFHIVNDFVDFLATFDKSVLFAGIECVTLTACAIAGFFFAGIDKIAFAAASDALSNILENTEIAS
jgi:hypothetical protein